MKFCFFGGYDPRYQRNAVLRRGLVLNRVEVNECRVQPKLKFWLRYPLLFLNFARSCRRIHSAKRSSQPFFDFLFVPEFCQKDIPLARLLSCLSSSKLIFDPLASRFETKIVDWQRKPLDSLSAWWNFRIDLWSFKMSDLVLADTQAHKKYYCQKYGIDSGKVEVLPLGYDDRLFKPLGGDGSRTVPEPSPFFILFFGSYLPLHGVEVIVEAARIVGQEDPSIRFRFIGSGQTFPRARARVSAYGLTNVEFQDWVPLENLPAQIETASVCLGIFGRTEKARRVVPHKIFQSMGMRKPVITARTPAVEEFFAHGENIFLCDEPLAESLAGAILKLRKDEELRAQIAQNGYELVKEKFSCQAVGWQLMEILKRKFLT